MAQSGRLTVACGVATLLLCLLAPASDACSCQFQHPQTHACQAHFVIVARVLDVVDSNQQLKYSLQIRKKFKMSEKATRALKSGKLWTPNGEEMCGVRLERGRTYLITGRIHDLRAYVNLCSYHKPWSALTKRQRKGFRMLYTKGCQKHYNHGGCEIVNCPSWKPKCTTDHDTCVWNMNDHCVEDHGICLASSSGQCSWVRNLPQRNCEKKRLEQDP